MSNLTAMTADFIGRISVAVWIGKLSDDAACEALEAFAAACERAGTPRHEHVHETILAEYRYRREGQELCS